MTVIGNWGTLDILDTELTGLSLDYGVRYAVLPAIYGNPFVQFIGKDVLSVELNLTVRDYFKVFDYWQARKTTTIEGNIKNLTLHTIDFGDFYHTDTNFEWEKLHYFINDPSNLVISESLVTEVKITVRGLQEVDL